MNTLLLFIALSLAAPESIIGYGCSANTKMASQYALEDIASQIASEVESTLLITRQVTEDGDSSYSRHSLRVSTDFVIIGATTTIDKNCVTASLSPASAPLYTEALQGLANEINAACSAAEKAEIDSLKRGYLQTALTAYNNYRRYAVPAARLGASIPQPICSENGITLQLEKLANTSADPAQIAKNIMSQLDEPVEVLPPELYGSYGVTAFSSVMKSEMQALTKPGKWDKKLRCLYSASSGKDFILSCSLLDVGGNVEKTVLTNVSGKVCEAIDCRLPASIQKLDALFSKGTGGLRGYFYTDYNEGALILSKGDILRLYARMSAPSELLLMALSADGTELYAIPISNKILKDLGKNDVGKGIELAKLTITPPYGTESLILFAYAGSLHQHLPKYTVNKETGLYLFAESPDAVLNELRALSKERYFEKSLIFTTMERIK